MIQFILVVVGLTIIICKPFLLFFGAAVGLGWLLIKRPNSFPLLDSLFGQRGERVNEPADDLSQDKGFTTYEERIEREMSNHKFKEGFQDDPEWQKQAKRAREYIQKARDLEEAELNTLGQNIKNQV